MGKNSLNRTSVVEGTDRPRCQQIDGVETKVSEQEMKLSAGQTAHNTGDLYQLYFRQRSYI